MTQETINVKNGSHLCRILSLDGGGSKGFYTLGILQELEASLGMPLHEKFDIIFGTSTGSIIASLLALGYRVEEIHKLYKENVPLVMNSAGAIAKSAALAKLAEDVFKDTKFDVVKTNLGIVTAKWENETPMIFKGNIAQAHGRVATFKPGFGCTISEAVQASCSAYPFFNKKTITTEVGDEVELVDGGYCANNPTLYAIADAVSAMEFSPNDCRVLSLGCGNYPSPKANIFMKLYRKISLSLHILEKTMSMNTASMEQLRKVLFKDVPTVRINATFDAPEMATDLFEHDLRKLNILRQRGVESFGEREVDIQNLMKEGDR